MYLYMLQSFVAPVIILAASLWTVSSCFLLSAAALPQTVSLYSSRGLIKEVYIFSRALLILNLSARKRLSLVQAAAAMLLICSFQLQLLVKVRPKCLCDEVSVIASPFISRGG